MSSNSIVFGLHAVTALLTKNPEKISRLVLLKERHDKKLQTLLNLATNTEIKIEFVSREELDRIAQQQNHQGVLAYCEKKSTYSENELAVLLDEITPPYLLLILDGVQDPHNLGACLRSADAAGVHAVIAPKDKSVGITPVVTKVASGATETLPFIQVTNLVRTLEFLKTKNIWIYGAAAEAEKNIYQNDLTGSVALVLGSEGSGLRRLTREHCDVLMSIPMQGSVTSLNVSVATGICLFEAVRQRCKFKSI